MPSRHSVNSPHGRCASIVCATETGHGLMWLAVWGLFGLFLLTAHSAVWGASAEVESALKVSRQVDMELRRFWTEKKVKPVGLADDAAFLRRLSLDLLGVAPSYEEVEAFLNNHRRDRRQQAVEVYLNSPLYVQHWTERWTKLLLGSPGRQVDGGSRGKLKEWVRGRLERNTPYNRMVYDLLTATGSTEENGATTFFARYRNNIPDLTGKVTATFLGVRIQCVQCHNSNMGGPLLQTDFWGIAAFFARTRVRRIRPMDGTRREYSVVEDINRGEARLPPPKDDIVVSPHLFLKVNHQPAKDLPRRKQIAELITCRENSQFAKAAVNRMWSHYFGAGIVEPWDDFRATNPPMIPKALEILADDFVEHGYDVKRLHRILVNTQAYQMSSLATPETSHLTQYFARARLRPLTPDQLFYTVLRVSTGLDANAFNKRRNVENMKVRYLQNFVRFFDTDEVEEMLEFDGTILQALWMMNGDIITENSTSSPGSTLQSLLLSSLPDDRKLDYLYMRILNRRPSRDEKRALLGELQSVVRQAAAASPAPGRNQTNRNYGLRSPNQRQPRPQQMRRQPNIQSRARRPGAGNRRAANNRNSVPTQLTPAQKAYQQFWEDVVWAMLNSSEFVFNH